MTLDLLPGELIVDLFAGGGGASAGIEAAVGRSPDLAINHDPAAIQMHMANHPATHHRCESIYDVDVRTATQGRPVGLLWASPSCTHFSRARGGTPVNKQVRGLGWMICRWAGIARPRLILCENVAEWETWGPVRKGQPVKRQAGRFFRLLVDQLKALGYTVEHRTLNAADYGAGTNRRRLFLVARLDAAPAWPAPTHGKGLAPVRTAADCLDWSNLGTSIFDRKRPLAPATCRRIAAGIVRYVLNGKPFLVQTGYGERAGQAPRIMPVDEPLGTIVAGGCKHALCTAFLAKHYGGVVGQTVDKPLGTITSVDHHSLVAAHLTTIDQQSNMAGHADAATPLSTITHKARHALVAAFLTTYYTGGGTAHPVSGPVPTIVTLARHGLVTVEIDGTTYAIADIRLRMLTPRELATAQGFPADYVLTGTQRDQIGRIGNSVCPPIAAALVAANMPQPRKGRAA
jgi:DNA (cytosine-5)-methyltransferase 1